MTTTRAQIVLAARNIYIEHGEHALSMRKVGEHVGISAAAIYRHFPDKEHLIMEVCAQGFELFNVSVMRGLRGKTALERLALTTQGYVDFALEHPHYYRVIFCAPHPDFKALQEDARDAFSPVFQMLIDRVNECQRIDVMHKEHTADTIALSVWAHMHGMLMLWLDGNLAWIGDAQACQAYIDHDITSFLKSFEHETPKSK